VLSPTRWAESLCRSGHYRVTQGSNRATDSRLFVQVSRGYRVVRVTGVFDDERRGEGEVLAGYNGWRPDFEKSQ